MTTKITADNITDSTITSAKILDGTIVKSDLGAIANAAVQWQSVVVADGSTGLNLEAGKGYFINTTSATQTATLPGSPSIGDTISIRDYAGTFGTYKLSINRNGNPIEGGTDNLEYTSNNFVITLVYVDGTRGWVTTESEAKSPSFPSSFTTATGGTITTSGDYKIHTFTGDGNFVVSSAGNAPTNPGGGPNTVSYLVVAGGGAGGANGAGGGGAGGFREGRDITPSHTASPLVLGSGLTITATTYPVTVGAGGSGATHSACANVKIPGSNSVFSTVTSAGGGGGGTGGGNPSGPTGSNPQNSMLAGEPGGSGGGVFDQRTNPAFRGVGNTPPVSPPQGQPGGNGVDFPPAGGGGGGGAGGAGVSATSPGNGPSPSNKGGNGGAGVTSEISGAPLLYSAGGGGGIRPGGSGGGDGGSRPSPRQGGSGAPHPSPDTSGETGQSGVANTGGGGGGGSNNSGTPAGGSGGKGVVVIRYKYQ